MGHDLISLRDYKKKREEEQNKEKKTKALSKDQTLTRSEKLEALKKEIESGQYKVDSDDLADAFLQDLFKETEKSSD